jgi:hypothetical protein
MKASEFTTSTLDSDAPIVQQESSRGLALKGECVSDASPSVPSGSTGGGAASTISAETHGESQAMGDEAQAKRPFAMKIPSGNQVLVERADRRVVPDDQYIQPWHEG